MRYSGLLFFFFFFKQKTAYEMRISDWSSDVCSSDLRMVAAVDGPVDLVAGIEARGFLFAAAIAVPLNAGVLLIRKDGKLPGATIAEEYALEYGHDRIAMHADACAPGARVLLIDDLIADRKSTRLNSSH